MKALVYFNPGPKNDCFQATRLRKNIKGCLELNNITWVESLFALPDLLHVISPEDEAKVHDAKADGLKVVVSALYCESDPFARYFQKDADGYFVIKPKAERMLEAADLVFVPSISAKNALYQVGIKNPHIRVLSPGVNLSRFEKSDPVEAQVVYRYLRFAENEKYVLAIGDYDNNEELTQFAQIAALVPLVRFFFVGLAKKGRVNDALLKKLNRDAPKNCRFLDVLEDDVFRSAMMNALVYLSFQNFQTDTLVALEAMASRCQILCLGRPLAGEAIEEKKNAYCFANVEKLAKGIESYCSGKLQPTIIEGYRKAKSCSLAKVGAELKADYESLFRDSEE